MHLFFSTPIWFNQISNYEGINTELKNYIYNEREKNPEIRSKLSRQLLAENNLFVVQRSFFIYWVMTSPNADATLHSYLLDPIKNKMDPF